VRIRRAEEKQGMEGEDEGVKKVLQEKLAYNAKIAVMKNTDFGANCCNMKTAVCVSVLSTLIFLLQVR
jgi:hypothetical protein